MTQPQILACLVLTGTMALFIWGRLRYDLVALISLVAGLAAGIVPFDKAFSGFSDDIVIIVASALLVSAAVQKSGIIAQLIRPVAPYLSSTTAQVVALTATVMVLSGFVKNIGALAMLMPVAFQLARKNNTSPAHLLMPMSFGALLGGIVTLIGTSPNIIVSRVRSEISGEPFQMFDFAPVGIGLALGGLVFLAFGWRLLPTNRKGAATMDAAFNIEAYTTELTVPEDSPFVGKTVGDLEKLGEGEVDVVNLIHGRGHSYRPPNTTRLEAGANIILQGEPDALERMVSESGLKLAHDESGTAADTPDDDIGVMEAIVTSESALVGKSAVQLRLFEAHGINLLAVSRSGRRILQRLGNVRLKAGDVVVFKGDLRSMPEALGELGALPLAERQLPFGRGRRRYIPALVLAVAMGLVAFNVVPVAIAFFGAAVSLLLLKALSLREAYGAVDMPILVMLAALIPVSDTLRSTGTTDLLAGWLSQAGSVLPPMGMLALIMVAAMAVTPFLNNAATVLVMAPIAASFAKALGLNPDPFLMAVAVGAACDFLTPIGHQCNTLVMGAGGYRFMDYPRLGLPLSAMVVILGTPLIALFWSF
ncbi:MAG TPA: SLC13 family permease [Xanthobacteraceae bacterium]|nr:SLC13 family permease [Xanthobacteraceae bacterium]